MDMNGWVRNTRHRIIGSAQCGAEFGDAQTRTVDVVGWQVSGAAKQYLRGAFGLRVKDAG